MRISDWSSDVCSSDLGLVQLPQVDVVDLEAVPLQQPRHREHRADAHLVGLAAGDRQAAVDAERSEERRVGKEGVSTCRSRWSPYHKNKKKQLIKSTCGYEENNSRYHDKCIMRT